MAIKIGTRGKDQIVGGAGVDALIGREGDDVLFGAGGYDILDGGRGFDIARYAGSFFEYSIRSNFIGYLVADLRSGAPDGIDLLHNVEALQFSDRIIYIDGRNNAPITVADAASANEDTALRIAAATLLGNDRDFDGDRLTLVSVGGATHGAVSLAAGVITFTPAANYNGPAAFTYTVRDARGAESTGAVSVNLLAVNDAPVNAVPGAKTVNEDQSLTVGGVGIADADGSTLRVSLSATHGALTLARTTGLTFTSGDGTADAAMTFSGSQANINAALNNLVYRPSLNYNGGDTIRLTSNDLAGSGAGGALGDTDTINVTVRAVNDAPVAVNDARSVSEDTTLVSARLLANDSDVEGSTLAAVLVSGPAHGTLTLNPNGTFLYTPVANYNGSDSFTYRASDGTVAGNTATVALSVLPVNDAPTFVGSGTVTVDFGPGQGWARSLGIQPNGKIVLGAQLSGVGGGAGVVRLNADGTLDAAFDGDGKSIVSFPGYDATPFGLVIQADGRIAIAGYVGNSSGADFAVARLNTNGSPDTTFDSDGRVTTGFGPGSVDVGHAVAAQSDGKLVVAGGSGFYDFTVARYNANGTLDAMFSGDGKAITALGPYQDYANAVAVQSNGKIVIAGVRSDGAQDDFAVVRYNAGGSVDTTFSGDGIVTTDFAGFNDAITGIAIQADGKILVGGYSGTSTGVPSFAAARYNVDGSLDTTFDGDGKLATSIDGNTSIAHAIALQANGKFVLAGGSGTNIALARYNADGSLDTAFDADGMVVTDINNELADAVAIQADGRIVVAGRLAAEVAAVRYNVNGSLDTTFGVGNTLDAAPTFYEDWTPVVLDDNVVVFDAELAAQGNYGGARLTLARHGSSNAEDSYSGTGALAALTQGSALLYGGVSVGTVATNSGGTLVLTFNVNATQDRVNGVLRSIAYANSNDAPPTAVQIDWTFSDGNTGAQGSGSTTVAIIPSLDPPIAADDSYSTDEGVPLSGSSVLANDRDPDGDPLTAVLASGPMHGTVALNEDGTFTYVAQAGFSGIDRFTYRASDGIYQSGDATVTITVEESAEPPPALSGKVTTDFGGSHDFAAAVALQADGRIVLAGSSITIINDAGYRDISLAQYNPDGSLDGTFGAGGKVMQDIGLYSSVLEGVAVQPDGRVVGVGRVDFDLAVFRFNTDGTLDRGFSGDGVATSNFSDVDVGTAVLVQPDARILAIGGTGPDVILARFNADGSPDTGFGGGDGKVTTTLPLFAYAEAVVLQTDGRILVAGSTVANPNEADYLVLRYLPDGTLDPSFGSGGVVTTDFAGGQDLAKGIALQADGKILVAGDSVNAHAYDFSVARYNIDGSLDTTFDGDGRALVDLYGDDHGADVVVQSDGKIVIGGTSGVADFGLVRLDPNGGLDWTFGNGGRVMTDVSGGADRAEALALQADGRIVLVGNTVNPDPAGFDFAMARYNVDGSLDTTFGAPLPLVPLV